MDTDAMTFPLQITFRHMPSSRIFENRIRELARRLEKFSSKIGNCHVVVEQPHRSATQGGLFDVHLSIVVPGCIIVVRRSHSADPKHRDAYVALRDAFNTAKRRLQDYEQMRRGEMKTHFTTAAVQEAPG
jgi:ribosome-associated translation inhibitor RaiA